MQDIIKRLKGASLLASVAVKCAAIAIEKMATQVQKANCMLWFHETNLVTAVQRRFRRQFWLNPNTKPSSYAWYKQFTQSLCLQRQQLWVPACFCNWLWIKRHRRWCAAQRSRKDALGGNSPFPSRQCGKMSENVCFRRTEYRSDVCRITSGTYIEIRRSENQKYQSSGLCSKNVITVHSLVLQISF
jgi:hypothetical protein